MRISVLIAIAAMLANIPSTAWSADPAFTIRQAIDAHGGADVLEKYPAMTAKMSGTMQFSGVEVPFTGTLAMQVPGKMRLELNIANLGLPVAIVQVVDGEQVSQTVNGAPLPLGGPMQNELKQMAAMQELSMLTPLLNSKRYTIKSEKLERAGNRSLAVITVRAKGMRDVKMYFDNKTGLLAKMQRRAIGPEMREVTEDTMFDDYQALHGMMVPMKSKAMHDGKQYMTMTFSDVELFERLDGAKLR